MENILNSLLGALVIISVALSYWKFKNEKYQATYYCLLIVFIASRVHVVFNNVEMDFDESMILSQAVTLKLTGGYFWEKLHGGSVGLLNTYQVLLFSKIGLPITYSTAHLISLVLSSITLIALFKAIKNYTGSTQTALFGMLPTLVFYIIGQDIHLVHLSSEQLSICLFSVVIYGYSVLYNNPIKNVEISWFFVTGLLLGMIPYSKLQSSLLVVFIAVIGIFMLYSYKSRWSAWLAFIFGGFFFSILNLIVLFKLNAFDLFWERYILDNVAYINDVELSKQFSLFVATIINEKALLIFVIVTLLLFIIGLSFKSKGVEEGNKRFYLEVIVALVFVLITIYTINKPGNYFLHYYLFFVLPLTVLNAVMLQRKLLLQKYVLSGLFIGAVGILVLRYNYFIVDFSKFETKKTEVELKIAPYFLSKNDYLTEFGRFGKHNIVLQQPQGTAMNFYEGMYNTRKNRLLEEFIKDIKSNRPIVLLEHNRWSQFDTAVPKLMPYINQNYVFLGEYMSENDQDNPDSTMKEKVYIRKDRYVEIQKLK